MAQRVSLPVVISSSIAILYCVWEITTFTVCMTASDLEKCLSFDTAVEIAGHLYFPIYM